MSYRQMWDEKTCRDIIDRTIREGVNLSKWENDFLESLSEQLDRRGTLSEKQQEILDRIYTEKTP